MRARSAVERAQAPATKTRRAADMCGAGAGYVRANQSGVMSERRGAATPASAEDPLQPRGALCAARLAARPAAAPARGRLLHGVMASAPAGAVRAACLCRLVHSEASACACACAGTCTPRGRRPRAPPRAPTPRSVTRRSILRRRREPARPDLHPAPDVYDSSPKRFQPNTCIIDKMHDLHVKPKQHLLID
ncbi:hypothetical protein B5X24_HaOG215520 [Helicoverpa armigera]|nr:hypothetical protein B5X24_HaOG215520 [Helicoverpa armigera]